MGITEDERTELHYADEAGKVKDFGVGIAAIMYAGEVEKFSTLIDFCPETLFESLLCHTKGSLFLDEVEMRKDADDFRKTMYLENVEEFEIFLYARF